MTAEPVPVHPPAHPLHALTTYELRDYRRDLEHALATLPGQAEARGLLRRRLADVVAEQESRAQASAGRA
jgi:hypothetical protein